MYNVNDLLAKIQAGSTPDDLANEFATALNLAMDLDKKNKEAELQKAKEAELDGYVNDMIVAMNNYLKASNPEVAALMDDDDDLIDPAELRKMLDASIATALLAVKLADGLDVKPSPSPSKAPKTSDDAISQFLKNFGL